MPLYIRDDDVRAMAQRLAEARGTPVTDAVREALRRELAGLDAAKAERDRRARPVREMGRGLTCAALDRGGHVRRGWRPTLS